MRSRLIVVFFNDTATTEIYTLSLHDALPISPARYEAVREDAAVEGAVAVEVAGALPGQDRRQVRRPQRRHHPDRKSTRLNSSHANISYAVFCLKQNTVTVRPEGVLTPLLAGR